MPDYKKMYLELFRAVTKAVDILQKSQLACEEIYIESGESGEAAPGGNGALIRKLRAAAPERTSPPAAE